MNRWLYKILARNLRVFLARNGSDRINGAAFEVGVGSGYWIELWKSLGADRVDGCDLVPTVVEDLNARFMGTFRVADVGADNTSDMGTYQLVACMNVLLHLTDDARFDVALTNVARLVAPGGRLLLTEPILLDSSFERPYDPELSSRARPLKRYREGLESEGLTLKAIAAGTAVGNNPIEARRRWTFNLWRGVWAAATLPSKIHPANAGWTGPVLYAADPLFLALHAAPSSKFALFERPT